MGLDRLHPADHHPPSHHAHPMPACRWTLTERKAVVCPHSCPDSGGFAFLCPCTLPPPTHHHSPPCTFEHDSSAWAWLVLLYLPCHPLPTHTHTCLLPALLPRDSGPGLWNLSSFRVFPPPGDIVGVEWASHLLFLVWFLHACYLSSLPCLPLPTTFVPWFISLNVPGIWSAIKLPFPRLRQDEWVL